LENGSVNIKIIPTDTIKNTAYPTKTDSLEKEKYILLLDFCWG
jgi:hypothetical protein